MNISDVDKTSNAALSILVVEDDSVDYESLKRAFASTSVILLWEKALADGLKVISEKTVDLVLLDLSLPDSSGIQSLSKLSEQSSVPYVVLTGLDDEKLALEALQQGAQDYLVKGQFEKKLLLKTVSYAIERHRLKQQLEESRAIIERGSELRRLEIATPSKSTVTATMYGQGLLSERSPEMFSQVVATYEKAISEAIEQRAFKIDNEISTRLKMLADELGQYKAIPRDIVAIHTQALNNVSGSIPLGKGDVCNEESRYLLIGMMGYLCSYYRRYYVGLTSMKSEKAPYNNNSDLSRG